MKIQELLESVTAGGMGTSAVATTSVPLGKIQRRIPKRESSMAEGSAHGYNVVKWFEKWNDQSKLVKWLRKEAGLPNDDDIYFDDADLVYGDKTIVRDALVDPNLKFIDLLNAVAQATGGKTKRYSQGIYRENGVAEAGNKPVEKYRLGMGDNRTARELKTQMQGASDEFVKHAAKDVGPLHSRVAKMQGKLAKSELRKREQGVAEGGVMKSIQRGLKGWQGSSHLTDIQDYIRNASDETLVRLYKNPGESPYKQTPRDIQIKLINRELKRRYGVKPGEQGVAEGWGTDEVTRYKNGFTVWHKKQTARPGEPEVWVYATPAGVSSDADAEMIIKKQQPLAKFPSLNMAFDAMKSGKLTSESIEENRKGVKAVKRKVASIEPGKPRNFVAKNAVNTGAGAHKDKKKSAKQGEVKHKNASYEN
jgi:hypothetical protein